jgi:hypothetical protein
VIAPAVWEVIRQAIRQYKGIECTDRAREEIERRCVVRDFEGGAFVVLGNEIDCYVTPQMRGRWASRSLLREVIGGVIEEYGNAVCRIHRTNRESLTLARRLGFKEISMDGDVLKLELRTWKL